MSTWIPGIPGEETLGWVNLSDDSTVRVQKHGDRYSVESVRGASADDIVGLAVALIQATPGESNLASDGSVYYGDVNITREEALAKGLALIRAAGAK